MYLICAARAGRLAISEEEVGCDDDAVCITDAVTDNNLSTPFSLNVFWWTVGQFISLHDSPTIVKFCLGMHYMHVLTFTEGISIWFLMFKKMHLTYGFCVKYICNFRKFVICLNLYICEKCSVKS